jgi:hypothetical protein
LFKFFEVENMSNWGFAEWVQIVQIIIGLVTSGAVAGWVIWQYRKDNETKRLRKSNDRLQLEVDTMKLLELAVIRGLLVDKTINFPTKKTPNGLRDSLRDLVRVKYYKDKSHNFPVNPTRTLDKFKQPYE